MGFYEQAFLLLIGFLVGYNYRGQASDIGGSTRDISYTGAAGQSDTY